MNNTIVLNKERDVTLSPSILKCGGEFAHLTKRPLVLVLPGGGYSMCSDREAEPIALAYNAAGFHAAVLRYSVGKHNAWPNPLEDYEQAMEYIKGKADDWNVDVEKIAVIGFSAGGHLASCTATIAKTKPCAVIMGYPVTLQRDLDMLGGKFPGTSDKISKDTPPCFIFATRTDTLVPIKNTVEFLSTMTDDFVDFECHIYSYGAHGFSTGTYEQMGERGGYTSRIKNWVGDSVEWLDEIFKGRIESIKKTAKYLDDNAEFLSTKNSIGAILQSPEAINELKKIVPQIALMGAGGDPRASLGMSFSVREVARYANISCDALDSIDELIKNIKNPLRK